MASRSQPAASTSDRNVGCPNCGSPRTAQVLYGEPAWSATLDADIDAGRVVLGGCVVDDESQRYKCRACGREFGGSWLDATEDDEDTSP